ncbi:hypothetical protein P5673_016546 [Acropora cervicornis]|uniref:Uncharacterized protein n=1 Tax=Acropora cervicornis TaxID=6130 RepID=A0AAD9QGC7_ACRCE|nr:hypothetical protein P5673_016546 [Acropora cervicornis]
MYELDGLKSQLGKLKCYETVHFLSSHSNVSLNVLKALNGLSTEYLVDQPVLQPTRGYQLRSEPKYCVIQRTGLARGRYSALAWLDIIYVSCVLHPSLVTIACTPSSHLVSKAKKNLRTNRYLPSRNKNEDYLNKTWVPING